MTLCEWAPKALAEKLLTPELCEVRVGSEFVVKETDKTDDGAAEVTLRFPKALPALLLHGANTNTGVFRFIENQQCADGALLVDLGNKRYAGYLLECKLTLSPKSLAKIQQQLIGAIYKLRAIVGLLEGRLEQVSLFAAFRCNRLNEARGASPILHHGRVGRAVPDSSSDKCEVILPLPGENQDAIPIRLVHLADGKDDTGYANVELALPPVSH